MASAAIVSFRELDYNLTIFPVLKQSVRRADAALPLEAEREPLDGDWHLVEHQGQRSLLCR